MTKNVEEQSDSWGGLHSCQCDFGNFEEEAHVLILWPLNAAISHLKNQAEAEDAKLEPHLSVAKGEEAEHYSDLQHWNWQYFDGQVRFLRNMALVGLVSRFIYMLRSMARESESVAPRKSTYPGSSELESLWTEFRERFGLDFSAFQEQIDYLDKLRVVRNQIVHDGGEANPWKPLNKIEIRPDGTFDMLDTKFSDKFPEFVNGSDHSAEVEVNAEQLNLGVAHSIAITRWISEQIRETELEAAEKERTARSTGNA